MLSVTFVLCASLGGPVSPQLDWITPFLAGARALEAGRAREALAHLADSERALPDHPQTLWLAAGAHARLGEADAAFAKLARCVERGGGESALLQWDPDLASLRSDARFVGLSALLDGSAATASPFQGVISAESPGAIEGVSSDGSTMVVVGSGVVRVVDTVAGHTQASMLYDWRSRVTAHLHPSGRQVVVCASEFGRYESRTTHVQDARSGEVLKDLGPLDPGTNGGFSPDGARFVARIHPNGHVVVFETAGWTIDHVLPFGTSDLCTSPDGDRLLMRFEGSSGMELILWDLRERRLLSRTSTSGVSGSGLGLRFSPGGTRAIATEAHASALRVLDARTGDEVATIRSESSREVSATRVSRPPRFQDVVFLDEAHVATLDDGGRLEVRAVVQEARRLLSAPGVHRLTRMHSTDDGRTILIYNLLGQGLSALDASSGAVLWSDALGSGSCFDPRGARVVYSVPDGSWVRRDVHTGVLVRVPGAWPQRSTKTCADPRGGSIWIGAADGSLLEIDARTGRALRSERAGSAPCTAVVASPDGTRIASCDALGIVRVLRADDFRPVAQLDLPFDERRHGYRTRPQFSRDGSALLLTGPEFESIVIDPRDGMQKLRVRVPGARAGAVLSPDGTLVAVPADGGRVRLLDVSAGGDLRYTLSFANGVEALAFEPDGGRLWVGTDQSEVILVRVANGYEVGRIQLGDLDHAGLEVGSITFRSDGAEAVIGSSGWAVIAGYRVEGLKRIWSFDYDGGNPAPMRSAFDVTGERVFVWGQMGHTPRIVSARDGRMLVDLSGRYRELVPLESPDLLGGHNGSELDGLRTSDGRRMWRRVEMSEGGWLLVSGSRHVDGSASALANVQAFMGSGSFPLDAVAARLLDPKRVRAWAEGVDVAPPPEFDVPTWDRATEQDSVDSRQPAASLEHAELISRSARGVIGFEIVVDGVGRFEAGEVVDTNVRRLDLRTEPRASLPTRVRAIDATGLRSRWARWPE